MAEEKKVVTKPHRRYLIIGLMMPQAVDRIIAVLVKRGYTVAPLSSARTAYLTADNNMVTIIALIILISLSVGLAWRISERGLETGLGWSQPATTETAS